MLVVYCIEVIFLICEYVLGFFGEVDLIFCVMMVKKLGDCLWSMNEVICVLMRYDDDMDFYLVELVGFLIFDEDDFEIKVFDL